MNYDNALNDYALNCKLVWLNHLAVVKCSALTVGQSSLLKDTRLTGVQYLHLYSELLIDDLHKWTL